LGATHSKDFVILACIVLIQYTSVPDRQTDGQTLKPWLRCAKHSAIACKNRREKLGDRETWFNCLRRWTRRPWNQAASPSTDNTVKTSKLARANKCIFVQQNNGVAKTSG